MAAQSCAGKLGFRSGKLGSSSDLAIAAPIADGNLSMDAHTAASRIGTYYDRTGGAEKIGQVVMGTEVLSIGVAAVTAAVQIRAPASTTSAAPLNIGQGTAPSSPANGDIWVTASGLFAQVAGSTVGPFSAGGGGSIGGSIANTQIAFGSGTNTIHGTNDWTISGQVMMFGSGTTLTLSGANGTVAGLNVVPGAVPAAPNNGDIWTTSLGFFSRAGGVTYKLDGHIVRDDQVNTFSLGGQTFASSSSGSASINIPSGSAPTAPNNGDIWTTPLGFFVRAGGVTYKLDGHIVRDDQVNTFSLGGQTFASSSSGSASINIPQGGVPTTPNNGDIWTTATGLFVRISGVTYSLGSASGTIGGSIAANQVAVGSGANTVAGDNRFLFNTSTGLAVNMASSGANNLTIGNSAGTGLSSGTLNTYLGDASGAGSTTNSNNTGVGYGALGQNTASDNTAVGLYAGYGLTSSAGCVAIGGRSLYSGGTGVGTSTAVGYGALQFVTSGINTALGNGTGATLTTGTRNTLIGSSADVGANNLTDTIVLGHAATALASNSFVVGSSTSAISNVFFGNGAQVSSPAGVTINATGGLGTNIAGASLTMAGGVGTGTGTGGAINFQTAKAGTAGSSANSLVTRNSVLQDGGFDFTGIATTSQPAVSAGSHGTMYFDSTTNTLKVSLNGAAYVDIGTGGGGTIGGSIASTQVAVGSGSNTISGSANFILASGNQLQLASGSPAAVSAGTGSMAANSTNGFVIWGGGSNQDVILCDRNTATSLKVLTGGMISMPVRIKVGGGLIDSASNAFLQVDASSNTRASLNLKPGAAPTSPFDGDVWTTTAGIYVQINGSTVGPLSTGTIAGSIAANQVAFGSGSNAIQGSSTLTYTATAGLALAPTAVATGSQTAMTVTGAANTNQTASTEAVGINLNMSATVQFATGALAAQRAVLVQAPTYAFVGASTLTEAATFAISGAPVTGANATLVHAYSFWVQNGAARFDGATANAADPLFFINQTGQAGNRNIFKILGGTMSSAAAGTEQTDILFNLNRGITFGTGALTTQRSIVINPPTLNFGGASTVTTAATLSITGAPAAGTNATITNAYAFQVEAGTSNFVGKIQAAASASGSASFNITQGSAPTSPVNGDIWTTSAGLFARINGTTQGPFGSGTGTIGGTATTAQVSYGSGSNTITSSAKFTFSATNGLVVNIASSGADNLTIGNTAGDSLTSGAQNTLLGTNAGTALTTTNDATAVGFNALAACTVADNVAVGSGAASAVTTSTKIVAIGKSALSASGATTGVGQTTAVGWNALAASTASANTAVGSNAGSAITSSTRVTVIGVDALSVGTTGVNDTTAIGYQSFRDATGNQNTGVGTNSGLHSLTGTDNVAIGYNADISSSATSAICIGSNAGPAHDSAIVIGKQAASTAANQLIMGSSTAAITDAYLGGGVTAASPGSDFNLRTTGGSGTDKVGTNMNIYGGTGTGAGVAGVIKLFTSPALGSGTTVQTQTQRLLIDTKGNIVPGTAALATSATDGFTYIETCAGTPTGVPTAYTGRAAMVYDSTNNKLYVYNGAWKGVTLT